VPTPAVKFTDEPIACWPASLDDRIAETSLTAPSIAWKSLKTNVVNNQYRAVVPAMANNMNLIDFRDIEIRACR